ncbi:unnamed protein product [Caenorhabditis sp. 36 PRJEB53466]|nr:unnamed protein product [Caenorhabditis sp. 36 PRJEB53466]
MFKSLSAPAAPRFARLSSKEGHIKHITLPAMAQSAILGPFAECSGRMNVPLEMNASTRTLDNLVSWCYNHRDDGPLTADEERGRIGEMPEWDRRFLESVGGDEQLEELIYIADYLDVRKLVFYGHKFRAEKLAKKHEKTSAEKRKCVETQSDSCKRFRGD